MPPQASVSCLKLFGWLTSLFAEVRLHPNTCEQCLEIISRCDWRNASSRGSASHLLACQEHHNPVLIVHTLYVDSQKSCRIQRSETLTLLEPVLLGFVRCLTVADSACSNLVRQVAQPLTPIVIGHLHARTTHWRCLGRACYILRNMMLLADASLA